MHFSALRTPGGYVMGEVRSALQKEIRRGNEREAMFWASEIDLAGYGNYVFKTLRTICSEDVGLGDPHMPATIWALYMSFKEARAAESKGTPADESLGSLFLMHAVLLLCRAPKSRMVDNAVMVMYWNPDDYPTHRPQMGMEIPDYALDHHTARGRKMGRTEVSVYDESYRVIPEAFKSPFAAEVRKLNESPPPKRRKRNGPKDGQQELATNEGNGERRALLARLHVRYAELNVEHDGDARGWALRKASRRFDRAITSSAQLSIDEARWLLNELNRQPPVERAKARHERRQSKGR